MLQMVDHLGHTITLDGLQPTKEKVCAIVEVPAPQNVSLLSSLLGLVNHLTKFFSRAPSISTNL